MFVPPGTTFPLDGTENIIILQGEYVTQARLDDVIRLKVIGLAILQPVNVTSSSYNLSVIGVDKIFVNYNGPVSIVLNTLYLTQGQDLLIAERGGFASPITITTSAGSNFDGDTSIILNSPYGRVALVFDGTNFAVVS